MTETVAVSTNDLKNISKDTFGKSHFFEIFELSENSFRKVETRENVLFMQSCELQGRMEHLHGLLGDVTVFVGSHFQNELESRLRKYGHHLITVENRKIEDALREIKQDAFSKLNMNES